MYPVRFESDEPLVMASVPGEHEHCQGVRFYSFVLPEVSEPYIWSTLIRGLILSSGKGCGFLAHSGGLSKISTFSAFVKILMKAGHKLSDRVAAM